jgi:signal transduction histidine kinase
MQRVGTDDPRDWRILAYAFGSLLLGHDEPARGDPLVSLVVHELRTPVAIIKAYAQLLDAQLSQTQIRAVPCGSHEIATHILEQADLMTDWVDAMLDVRRLQLSELPLERTPVDLTELAWTVAQELQQTTRLHRIRVLASRRMPPPILGDRARLRQVLTNLLENAVKYAAGGPIQVRVGLQPAVQRAMIAVHDTGPGLDPARLGAIFAPYEQAERRGVGLGLGLYLSRQIARLHGGDLWAESRGPMNGSTFILALPVAS